MQLAAFNWVASLPGLSCQPHGLPGTILSFIYNHIAFDFVSLCLARYMMQGTFIPIYCSPWFDHSSFLVPHLQFFIFLNILRIEYGSLS